MANQNEQFLSVIDGKTRALILESIATHYGITSRDAYAQVTGSEAEHILEYLVEPQRSVALALLQRHGLA